MRSVPLRLVLGGLLLAALLLAGVASYHASSDPDGLNRVAEDEGFAATEEDHAAAEGPLAGYETAGVDNARLSGGLAGVAGAGVVLLVMGGVAYAVRRRGPGPQDAQPVDAEPADAGNR